jgi:hypothetical protein
MRSTASIEMHSPGRGAYRASVAEVVGGSGLAGLPRPAPRRRPEVALRPRDAAVDGEGAALSRPLHRSRAEDSRRLRQFLEIALVVLFCLGTALTLWLNQDDRCALKLYRDPVTGRMVKFETAPESRKLRIACAHLGDPER